MPGRLHRQQLSIHFKARCCQCRRVTYGERPDCDVIDADEPGHPRLESQAAEGPGCHGPHVRSATRRSSAGHDCSRFRGPFYPLVPDHLRRTYEDLVAKGVEVTQEPTEQPYGIDWGRRDPFGDSVRFSQPPAG